MPGSNKKNKKQSKEHEKNDNVILQAAISESKKNQKRIEEKKKKKQKRERIQQEQENKIVETKKITNEQIKESNEGELQQKNSETALTLFNKNLNKIDIPNKSKSIFTVKDKFITVESDKSIYGNSRKIQLVSNASIRLFETFARLTDEKLYEVVSALYVSCWCGGKEFNFQMAMPQPNSKDLIYPVLLEYCYKTTKKYIVFLNDMKNMLMKTLKKQKKQKEIIQINAKKIENNTDEQKKPLEECIELQQEKEKVNCEETENKSICLFENKENKENKDKDLKNYFDNITTVSSDLVVISNEEDIEEQMQKKLDVYRENINKAFKRFLKNDDLCNIWDYIDESITNERQKYQNDKSVGDKAYDAVMDMIDCIAYGFLKKRVYEFAQCYTNLCLKMPQEIVDLIRINTKVSINYWFIYVAGVSQGVSLQKIKGMDLKKQEVMLQEIKVFLTKINNKKLLQCPEDHKFVVGDFLIALSEYMYFAFVNLEHLKHLPKEQQRIYSGDGCDFSGQFTVIKDLCEYVISLDFWVDLENHPIVDYLCYMDAFIAYNLILADLAVDELPVNSKNNNEYNQAVKCLKQCNDLLLKIEKEHKKCVVSFVDKFEHYASLRLLFDFKCNNNEITEERLVKEEIVFFERIGGKDNVYSSFAPNNLNKIKPYGHFRTMVQRMAVTYLQQEKYYVALLLFQQCILPWIEMQYRRINSAYIDSDLFVVEKELDNLNKEKQEILKQIELIKKNIFAYRISQLEFTKSGGGVNSIDSKIGKNYNDLLYIIFNKDNFSIDIYPIIEKNDIENNIYSLLNILKNNINLYGINFCVEYIGEINNITVNNHFNQKLSISLICPDDVFDKIKDNIPSILKNVTNTCAQTTFKEIAKKENKINAGDVSDVEKTEIKQKDIYKNEIKIEIVGNEKNKEVKYEDKEIKEQKQEEIYGKNEIKEIKTNENYILKNEYNKQDKKSNNSYNKVLTKIAMENPNRGNKIINLNNKPNEIKNNKTNDESKPKRTLYLGNIGKNDIKNKEFTEFTDFQGVYTTKLKHTGGKSTFFYLSQKLIKKYLPTSFVKNSLQDALNRPKKKKHINLETPLKNVISSDSVPQKKKHKSGPCFKNGLFSIKFSAGYRVKSSKGLKAITVFNSSTNEIENIHAYKLDRIKVNHVKQK